MDTRNILTVARYEMKINRREWIFRLFSLLAVVGIVACHAYWQGGAFSNWKMVALPCSMPLVNAYLFTLLQSLFLAIMVADQPSREKRYNTRESLDVRPWGNREHAWGKMVGLLASFSIVNLVVIALSVFVVNLTSEAPLSVGYYFFYALTLNVPSFIFLYGLGSWLVRCLRSRFVVILLLEGVVMLSAWWLPYHFRGTWDFTASGIPNLFSEFTGHVGARVYLFHRVFYLLAGLGFFCLGSRMAARMANSEASRRGCAVAGIFLLLAGGACAFSLERGYRETRRSREAARESFRRHWSEVTCRVTRNDLVFRQSGSTISVSCDLTLYNPNGERLPWCVLFLNPGLELTALTEDGRELAHERDGQVIVVRRVLEAGNSVRLRLAYAGRVDGRYADLHLPDERYENTFRGDLFFPTGRESAFVRDDYLLLTPASLWYPVAYPPVNPGRPLATGRDFTRFSLEVESPRQKVVVSQGRPAKRGGAWIFRPARALAGISLCGGDYGRQSTRFGELEGVLYSRGGYRFVLDRFPKNVNGDALLRYESMDPTGNAPGMISISDGLLTGLMKKVGGMEWYDPVLPRYYLFETPVSYYTESSVACLREGQSEPGMSFWPERGFGLDVVPHIRVYEEEDKRMKYGRLVKILYGSEEARCSHPLWGMVRGRRTTEGWGGLYGVEGCVAGGRSRVFSTEFPFIDRVLERWEKKGGWNFITFFIADALVAPVDFEVQDYWTGHSFPDFMEDRSLPGKMYRQAFKLVSDELFKRLTLEVPEGEVLSLLKEIRQRGEGDVAFDTLCGSLERGWGVDFKSMVREWERSRHEHYYRVKDFRVTAYQVESDRVMHGILVPEYHYEATGMIENRGKESGVVVFEFVGSGLSPGKKTIPLNLLPGEAKKFKFVSDMNLSGINTGLSANRPKWIPASVFERLSGVREARPLVSEWDTISPWLLDTTPGEIVVDNEDAGFELRDGELTWLQRVWEKKLTYQPFDAFKGSTRWQACVHMYNYGDSLRSCYCKSGGKGKSAAIWRTVLPESGRYRVMSLAYSRTWGVQSSFGMPKGIVLHYTVASEEWEERVEVNLDVALPSRASMGWVSLGEFDFEEGEASVTLSDEGKENTMIVADAVKWVKVDK